MYLYDDERLVLFYHKCQIVKKESLCWQIIKLSKRWSKWKRKVQCLTDFSCAIDERKCFCNASFFPIISRQIISPLSQDLHIFTIRSDHKHNDKISMWQFDALWSLRFESRNRVSLALIVCKSQIIIGDYIWVWNFRKV